ncbi:hypothetical protein D917_00776 [Trichinella nativa]|uniref:Uncharacterized protein n=1 Tax=Trichinella nativa TaxID=6335 RepID=A0A1Y3E528_9BILA|nr:hypothetical protein D917_00776 [Trichinella nativa]
MTFVFSHHVLFFQPCYITVSTIVPLDKNGTCFQYLCTQFHLLSDAKLKEGIFIGPDIQKLIKDKLFSSTMKQVEEEA